MPNDLPRLDDCVATYLDLWDRFGDDPFAAADLAGEATATEDPDRRLALLVAYGLLDATDEGEYRVRCPPTGTHLEWRDRFVDRADRLYGMVDAAFDARSSGDRDEGLLTHRGRSYVGVRIDEGTDAETVAARARSLAESGDLHAGLVLRCPADEADRAQAVADALTEAGVPGFEKVTSEVTGVDSDALQFRLYVAPADRD